METTTVFVASLNGRPVAAARTLAGARAALLAAVEAADLAEVYRRVQRREFRHRDGTVESGDGTRCSYSLTPLPLLP